MRFETGSPLVIETWPLDYFSSILHTSTRR